MDSRFFKLMGRRLLFVSAMAALAFSCAFGAQRAKTYDEALAKAGPDGVAVFCYAPDWNKRSVKLLQTFWNSPAAEAALGDAVMVAVPFYQESSAKGADSASSIRGGMPSVPKGTFICPAVLMVDKDNRSYAYLPGTDFLGEDDACTLGCKNMKEKLECLRKRDALLEQAKPLVGVEKAKILAQVADLPITPPAGIVEEIELADPTDKTGAVRRNKFSPLMFMYKQLDTEDGFLAPDFEADYPQMKKDCEAILADTAYRARDRQAVYNLYIGESRRQLMSNGRPTAPQLKGFIKKGMKADETTDYGRLSPTLEKLWGAIKYKPSAEMRDKKREEAKAKKEKKRQERNAERNIEIN